MNPRLLPALLPALLLPLPALAVPDGADRLPAAPAANALQITPDERRFFALGRTLARGAFAYAELAKSAGEVAKTRSRIAQVGKLARLDPTAARNRKAAGARMAEAAALLRTLHAPPSALAPIERAAERLAGRLPLSSDARPVSLFSREAARTLSALNEFEALSSLPEDPALRAWLSAPGVPASASVWYGEGEIAGLAQIAATHGMPDLLPPSVQIAADLRGLRDWLALRLPEPPSPEQAALKDALESFLRQTAAPPQTPGRRPLTETQLQALGDISRRLQVQVLGPETG